MKDFGWGLIAILLTIACAALFPLGLIVLAPALLFGGLSARRRSHDARTSGIANGAIAGGIAGIALIVVVVVFLFGWSYTTSFGSGGGSGTSPSTIRQAPAP